MPFKDYLEWLVGRSQLLHCLPSDAVGAAGGDPGFEFIGAPVNGTPKTDGAWNLADGVQCPPSAHGGVAQRGSLGDAKQEWRGCFTTIW